MKTVYGFVTSPNGLLEIIPEQAAIVQEIYRQYLSGKSLGGIADFLFEKGISSPSGKEHWSRSVLDAMLSNSKYLNGIVSFEDYFAVQVEKGKRSNIDEDSNKRKATQYYEKVKSNPQWALIALYADQGVTGTSTKHRKQFMRMIRDCEKGKIGLIITKFVSRFSRNTLDGLKYVRKLKNLGVGVYFEKENVNTLIMDNELILTFMMSGAQAESESMSGNVKWGHRKNFKDGKVYYHYNNFLGYREGEDGNPEIAPEEAEIVKRIFSRYLQGQSVAKIIAELEADGIKTVRGNNKWNDGVIRNMLTNEKYMGDALLQKTFVSDIFTRRSEKNLGQLPKYYVHECHPAIIDRETFYQVQEEMARRSSLPQKSINTKDRTFKVQR